MELNKPYIDSMGDGRQKWICVFRMSFAQAGLTTFSQTNKQHQKTPT